MSDFIYRPDVIVSLKPGAKFSITDNVLTWLDEDLTQPTQEEMEAEAARLNDCYARGIPY